MDQRILTVLKDMARGRVCLDDMRTYCLYCTGDEIYSRERKNDGIDDVEHTKECPILLARAVLKEQEIPLRLYTVTFDYPPEAAKRRPKNAPPQKTISQIDTGYGEDDIRKRYQTCYNAGKEYPCQNVQVVYMREV